MIQSLEKAEEERFEFLTPELFFYFGVLEQKVITDIWESNNIDVKKFRRELKRYINTLERVPEGIDYSVMPSVRFAQMTASDAAFSPAPLAFRHAFIVRRSSALLPSLFITPLLRPRIVRPCQSPAPVLTSAKDNLKPRGVVGGVHADMPELLRHMRGVSELDPPRAAVFRQHVIHGVKIAPVVRRNRHGGGETPLQGAGS